MRASQLQDAVSTRIARQYVDDVAVGLSDTHYTVMIEAGDLEAAYTAEEAHAFADYLETRVSDDDWTTTDPELPEYLRDLARVVDGEVPPEAVREKWSEEQIASR